MGIVNAFHDKRGIVEPGRTFPPTELQKRLCVALCCSIAPHLAIPKNFPDDALGMPFRS